MATPEPTITLSQIAALAGVSPSAVGNWRRRFPDFPRPIATAAGGRDLYSLEAVEAWLRANDRFDSGRQSEKLLFEAANVLRGQTPSDEGIALLAAAVALSEFCDRLGIPLHDDISERIAEIEHDSPGLVGVFDLLRDLDPAGARQLVTLTDAIDEIRRVDVFEWVLSQRRRFVDTRTSEDITGLLAALVGDAETILDPAAGEAGVLTAIALASADKVALTLYGQEINKAAWRIAVQRLFLHLTFGDIELGDSLLDDKFSSEKVDAVVCDPPYGMRNPIDKASAAAGSPWMSFNIASARTADFAWLEYAISHLAPEGHAYVVLPASTLSRRGREGDLRADLLRRGAVEAVVALPPGAADRTAISLAVWVLRPPQPSPDNFVLVIDASRTESGSGLALDGQIPQITDAMDRWRADRELPADSTTFAVAAPVIDVLASDADLSPERWVAQEPTVTAEEAIRLASDAVEAFLQVRNRIVHDLNVAPPTLTPTVADWVPVRDLVRTEVAEVVRGVRVKPDECGSEGVRVLRTRDIGDEIGHDDPCFVDLDNIRPRPDVTAKGDIIISPASGRLRAVVDEEGGHVLAAPLQGLRIRTALIDPHVAAAFLQDKRNRRFAKGTSSGYARVDVRDLELPVLPLEEAAKLREELDHLIETERAARVLAHQAEELRDVLLSFVRRTGEGG